MESARRQIPLDGMRNRRQNGTVGGERACAVLRRVGTGLVLGMVYHTCKHAPYLRVPNPNPYAILGVHLRNF